MAHEEYSNVQKKKRHKCLTVYDTILSSRNLVFFYWTPQHFVHNTVFLLDIYLCICFLFIKKKQAWLFLKKWKPYI